MTLTSLISNVAVYCSLALTCVAQDTVNYSLWPRRPEELERARKLVSEQKLDEAVELLQPFVKEKGIAGREARQITGSINVRRYLSLQHPGASVYVVKRGENLARIAAYTHCPSDVLMLLNGMIEPSDLKVGQKIVTIPMTLRMEIRPLQREITIWDGSILVVSYNIDNVTGWKISSNTKLAVKAREGYMGTSSLPSHSTQFLCSRRVLVLEQGVSLSSEPVREGACLVMSPEDVNELVLLMGIGGRVDVVMDEADYAAPVETE